MYVFISFLCLAFAFTACENEEDCSFNGVCHGSACVCDAAWTGKKCSILNFRPAVRGAGLHTLEADGRNTSTWGGSVLKDEKTGTYHMWAAEMINHCGIHSWTRNSRIVHATSLTATGTYTRVEEVFGVFSHEPNVVRGPQGEWVMFFSAHLPWNATPSPHRPPCKCVDGSTSPKYVIEPSEGALYVSWAENPNGPWTDPLEIISINVGTAQSDTNLAPVILPDGKLVGIWRLWNAGSWCYLATASNWKDPKSYVFHHDLLFPELTKKSMGTEDPTVYLDAKRRFHALFHNMQPHGNIPATMLGHAFSEKGLNWTYTGVAGNSSGLYTDGTQFAFTRRERPHVVFAPDGTTILAVTNGVQYNDSTTAYQDATFTFLQPVAT